MALVDRNYRYDIFVSYSNYEEDWVRPFHDDLVREINRRGERDIEPFLDKVRLAPGSVWDEALQAAAADSAVFIPVLSERFFASEYCQKEIRIFTEAHGLESGEAYRSRIVPIRLLCQAPPDHLLAKIQDQIFCETKNEKYYEYQRGTTEYRQALTDTAYAIVQILQKASSGPSQGVVYLASAGPDLKSDRDKLRNALAHHYHVVPENTVNLLEMGPDELRRYLAADLGRAFVSVHLVGSPTATPPGAAATLAELQLQAAAASQKPRLIWQPGPAIGQADRDKLCNDDGFQWFKRSDDLQDHILRLWRKLTERKLVTRPDFGEFCIYFICPNRANQREAEETGLLSVLRSRRYGVYFSPLDGDAAQALQSHIQALAELDGCLIYYGEVEPEWFKSVYLRVHKVLRQRKVPRGVYLAPPPNDHKKNDLPYLGIPILDPAGRTVEQALAPFLEEFNLP